MTRPPVGSKGTLDKLQVEPGDVVRMDRAGHYWWTEGKHYTIEPAGKIIDDEEDDHWISAISTKHAWTLISRANPDQLAHIIAHEGREYDLTALETPFGLLPEPVQAALKAWPYGVCWYHGARFWQKHVRPEWAQTQTYRAVPAPAETRVECYRGEYSKVKEHGTCIKRHDGSIDWQSWEPDA